MSLIEYIKAMNRWFDCDEKQHLFRNGANEKMHIEFVKDVIYEIRHKIKGISNINVHRYRMHSARKTFANKLWQLKWNPMEIDMYGGWKLNNAMGVYIEYDILRAFEILPLLMNINIHNERDKLLFNINKHLNP